jgi:translation initiation factor 2 alpha subunit (eIF-2alpha)
MSNEYNDILFFFLMGLTASWMIGLVCAPIWKRVKKHEKRLKRLAEEYYLDKQIVYDTLRAFGGVFPALEASKLLKDAIAAGNGMPEWHDTFCAFVEQHEKNQRSTPRDVPAIQSVECVASRTRNSHRRRTHE